MVNIKLISKDDVKEKLTMKKTIELVEKVYTAHGNNHVVMPSKITLDLGESTDWPPYGGSYNAMPAYLGEDFDMAGIKWVWGFNDNFKKGIPYISGVIILNDPRTGEVLSIMDGGYITDIRTGAATGVSAKYLISKKAKNVGIIGAGVQGRMNLRAMNEVMNIEHVYISDIRKEASEKFAKEMSEELGLKITAADCNKEACIESDVIITVTIANEALVMKEWLKKGCTVFSVGSFQELDEKIPLTADKLVVDNWGQNAHRGELVKLVKAGKITEKNIYAEIPEIIVEKKAGRENDDEIICASVIGMGSTDIGIASELFKTEFAEFNKNVISLR